MINILIKDHRNNQMQEMHNLRYATEQLICNNINKLNSEGYDLNIETLTNGVTKYWENRGFKHDDSLYDRLILEYTQANQELLARWK